MQQACGVIGYVKQTAIHDRLLGHAFRPEIDTRDSAVDLLPIAALEDHMPFRPNLISRSIGTEGDRRLIGGAVVVAIVGDVPKEKQNPAIAIELGLRGSHST